MFEFLARWPAALYLRAHRRTFRRRLARQTVFEQLYVVSVGNLSAGGTGKTPVALLLAEQLRGRGVPALAVLRGYGGTASKTGLLVSDGTRVFADLRAAGDEALLFARAPGLRVAVGRDRVSAILRFAGDARVVLLDDAFQNPLVGRDHELVLIDALVPLRKMLVFPAGRFREPPEALSRADTIVLPRADLAPPEQLDELTQMIARNAPRAAVFRGRHAPGPVVSGGWRGSSLAESTIVKLAPGTRVGAFCGLGNPDGFFRSLSEGPHRLDVVYKRAFADHHPYTAADVRALFRQADRAGLSDLNLITSAKDFVRLAGLPDLPEDLRRRILVLEISFEVLENRQAEFLKRVIGPALLE